MRKFLAHDAETRELRLVYTDLWDGQHERTEYRVTSERAGGNVVRDREDLHGKPILGTVPGLYFRNGSGWGETQVWTQEVAVGLTVKTPCPKAVNARRKCTLCADGN